MKCDDDDHHDSVPLIERGGGFNPSNSGPAKIYFKEILTGFVSCAESHWN